MLTVTVEYQNGKTYTVQVRSQNLLQRWIDARLAQEDVSCVLLKDSETGKEQRIEKPKSLEVRLIQSITEVLEFHRLYQSQAEAMVEPHLQVLRECLGELHTRCIL